MTSTVQSAEAAEEEEHRWLLHSSRIARAYSEQLVETESPYYPKLIEQELIVDDSRDEHAEPDSIAILSSEQAAEHESAASSPASPSSAHSSPVIRPPASVSSSRLNPDLISSYEQLAFIRFPPSLWSLLLHRYVYAALGLLQEPWPVWKESRSEDDELWWLWWLWCWQAVWALACVLGLGWLCWLRVVDSESEPLLTRALLSACDVASVCCALLLSHAVLSHRMLGSRVYFLSRNSSSPRNAAAAVNRAVYRSLAALLLIAAAGVYLDTRSAPSSLPSASSSSPVLQPAVLSLQLTAQAWLWLSCVVLLRLQYAAGVCVLVCLVDVHILRVEQARKAVLAAEGDEEGVAAQVVDIELSVQDVADRLGSFVSVLLAACVLSAVTAAVSAADGANATAAAGGGAALRLLYPLLVALFLLQAVTRLNQVSPAAAASLRCAVAVSHITARSSCVCLCCGLLQACSRFRAAVLSFPLLHPRLLPAAATASPAAASVMPPARSSSLWISIPCPEVSLLVCGVRLSYGSLWLFLLLWSALLLWLTQTGRLR